MLLKNTIFSLIFFFIAVLADDPNEFICGTSMEYFFKSIKMETRNKTHFNNTDS